MEKEKIKIALVCDFLTKFGGAQKVLLALHKIYPDASIHCLLYDEKGTKGLFRDCEIIPSGLNRLPEMIRKRPKFLLPFFSKEIENFDFSEFDIVISSNDSFAHGILTKPSCCHICYCHTPMRYSWDWYHEYLTENKLDHKLSGLFVRILLHNIRIWDRVSADRVDYWISNSKNVQKRITKYYRANSELIYPPIDTSEIIKSTRDDKPQNYYLIVSRLEPYKQIDLAIHAFNRNNKKLVIIGEGSQEKYLKKIAMDNIKFVDFEYGEKLYSWLGHCRALIFPGEDDFGITPVEAMAAGRPVIAYGRGGALESIVSGKTGEFFDQYSINSLNETVAKLEENYSSYSSDFCREQAKKFSASNFEEKILNFVTASYADFKRRYKIDV